MVYGIITPIGAGMMYSPLLASTLKWFPNIRERASGLLLSAASISPFIMSPILNAGYISIGIQKTLLFYGTAMIIISVLLSKTQVKAPEDYVPEGWIPEANNQENIDNYNTVKNYTPQEMVKTGLFYEIVLIFTAASVAGNMIMGVLYTISLVQISLTAPEAAIAVSIINICNFGGRLSFGVIYDKIGSIGALLLSFGITIAALIIMSFANSSMAIVFFIAVAMLGFSFGGPMVIFPPLTAKIFGQKHLGINYGIIFFGYSLSAFVGPRIAMHFYSKIGTFLYSYYASAVLGIIGILFVIDLKKKLDSKIF